MLGRSRKTRKRRKKARNAKKAAGKVLREEGLDRRVPGGGAESELLAEMFVSMSIPFLQVYGFQIHTYVIVLPTILSWRRSAVPSGIRQKKKSRLFTCRVSLLASR